MSGVMEEISLGGARGLEVISLAECKGIIDEGIKPLAHLKYLSKVILLGCLNIKDTGIRELAESLVYLEDLNLGGTVIKTQLLHDLVELCLNLRRMNISGCKELSVSDDQILKRHKINVESGEDVFRFHLQPEDNTDLPKITSSVLKTRGTLSMNKVYRYLIRKLAVEKAIEAVPDD